MAPPLNILYPLQSKSEKYYRVIMSFLCWGSLILQFWLLIASVKVPSTKSYLTSIGEYFSYLTIWTNIIVGCVITLPLIDKRAALTVYLSRPFIQTAVLVYILIVCISYHILLSEIWDPQGWQKIADISLHYGLPILYFLFWLLYVPKGYFIYSKVYTILSYPLVYLVFAMLVGITTNYYSYYFLDAKTYGYPEF